MFFEFTMQKAVVSRGILHWSMILSQVPSLQLGMSVRAKVWLGGQAGAVLKLALHTPAYHIGRRVYVDYNRLTTMGY